MLAWRRGGQALWVCIGAPTQMDIRGAALPAMQPRGHVHPVGNAGSCQQRRVGFQQHGGRCGHLVRRRPTGHRFLQGSDAEIHHLAARYLAQPIPGGLDVLPIHRVILGRTIDQRDGR